MTDTPTQKTAQDSQASDGQEGPMAEQQRERSSRRQFVALGASAATVLLAGCSGDDSDDGENGNESENGGANGEENGGANGNESENGGANGEENGGANGEENGEENGGEASASLEVTLSEPPEQVEAGETVTIGYSVENTGDAEGTDEVSFTVAGEQQRSEEVTVASGSSTTGEFTYEVGDDPSEDLSFGVSTNGDETESTVTVVSGSGSLGDELSSEEFFARLDATTNFRFEISGPQNSGTGRLNGEDFYLNSMSMGQESEVYFVDGTGYTVQGDQCFQTEFDFDPEVEPENVTEPVLSYVGTDSIEGDSVEVYEAEFPNQTFQTTTTYYVLPSGRVRRTETGDSTTDFFDWGNAEPISRPDLECQSIGDIGSDDGFGSDGGFGSGDI